MRRWLLASQFWRRVFWCFAAVLFVATHTPSVQMGTEVRYDLLVHIGALGAWTGLLLLAAYFGGGGSWPNIRMVWPIAVIYAAVDEALQAIPFVHRTAALDDWGADVCGITIACFAAIFFDRLSRSRAGPGTDG